VYLLSSQCNGKNWNFKASLYWSGYERKITEINYVENHHRCGETVLVTEPNCIFCSSEEQCSDCTYVGNNRSSSRCSVLCKILPGMKHKRPWWLCVGIFSRYQNEVFSTCLELAGLWSILILIVLKYLSLSLCFA
jgi:hypothetical protein